MLEALCLDGYFFVDLSDCVDSGSTLQTIVVRESNVTNASLFKISTHCQMLETLVLLDASSDEAWTDPAIQAITQNCRKLRSLELSWYAGSLKDIFGGSTCVSLTRLCLQNSWPGLLTHIARCAPHLEELYFASRGYHDGCDPEEWIAAAISLPRLRRLYSPTGPVFSTAQLVALAAALPSCEAVEIFAQNDEAVAHPDRLFAQHAASAVLSKIKIGRPQPRRVRGVTISTCFSLLFGSNRGFDPTCASSDVWNAFIAELLQQPKVEEGSQREEDEAEEEEERKKRKRGGRRRRQD
jgi:hypothetical protein